MRRAFYDVMMADVGAKRVADDWRRVLYALLKKPASNSLNLVGERREIALMAQDIAAQDGAQGVPRQAR